VAKSQAILLTGTIGVGKTVVATELCEILEQDRVPVAVIDLDWLGWVSISPPQGPNDLIAENLKSVLPNFRASGIDRFVLSRTITNAAQAEAIRSALPETSLQVVRLRASRATVADRLTRRDDGVTLEKHLAESVDFEAAAPGIEDYTVTNEDRAPREVAHEILRRSGWA
jgi:adenylylsulfate kinase